jgi:hypothetical protein
VFGAVIAHSERSAGDSDAEADSATDGADSADEPANVG